MRVTEAEKKVQGLLVENDYLLRWQCTGKTVMEWSIKSSRKVAI